MGKQIGDIQSKNLESEYFKKISDLKDELLNLKIENENLKLQLKRQTELTKNTQKQYLALVKAVDQGILVEDENNNILLINRPFIELFNLQKNPKELFGVNNSNFGEDTKHFFKNPEEYEFLIDQIRKDQTPVFNEEIYFKDGKIFELGYYPLRLNNKYMGCLWRMVNITERRLKEQTIAEKEKKYRKILNNMNIGVLEVDNNDIILKAYEGFCELSGYSEEELIGQKANDLFSADFNSEKLVDKENENRKLGLEGKYEIQFKKKSGDVIYVIVSASPIYNEKNEIIGSIGIHSDISQQKSDQINLQIAKKELEEARKHEKLFLANVSHEIRTPINGIVGMTHLLLDTKLQGKQKEYLENIKFSSEILMNLVSDVLDFSKIDAGEMHASNEVFSINNLLSGLFQIFKIRAMENDIDFSFKIGGNLPDSVISDSTFLSQILINLLNNAIKFTEKGNISLELNLVHQIGNVYLTEFIIEDTGIGMSDEQLGKIFDSYKQASNSIKNKYGGTGLGLNIVKKLVNILGGEIYAESKENVGSKFTFTIPLLNATSDLKIISFSKDKIKKQLEDKLILLVEDNIMNRKYAEALLKKWGINFDVAVDGEEALRKSTNKKYDLIFMDISLPKFDGFEVTKQIRTISKENPNRFTPIVALTAAAFTDELEKVMKNGMDGYLTKPYTPENLFESLQLHLTTDQAQLKNKNNAT